uniref:Uncharacterized protein n=1 Tax=Trichuris muris TaxID=70415 RepID=A0A5S6QMY3_TRIMR
MSHSPPEIVMPMKNSQIRGRLVNKCAVNLFDNLSSTYTFLRKEDPKSQRSNAEAAVFLSSAVVLFPVAVLVVGLPRLRDVEIEEHLVVTFVSSGCWFALVFRMGRTPLTCRAIPSTSTVWSDRIFVIVPLANCELHLAPGCRTYTRSPSTNELLTS